MADNHFDLVIVWDNLGGAVRVNAGGRATVLDPATGALVSVVQGGQSVSTVTADENGRVSFVAQQGTVKLVSGGLAMFAVSSEQATAGADNAAAAQAAQAATEAARDDVVNGLAAKLDAAALDSSTAALVGGAGETGTALDGRYGRRLNLVDTLPEQFLIAHRGGGALIHPEHSMQAYRAAVASGYLPEQDVNVLADGTLVNIHDTTVDRTMTGTGNVADLTLAQWQAMRIKPLMDGLPQVKPTTWQQVLDEFGGRTVLVPEVKDATAASALIDSIVARGLQRSVIAQSFEYAVCQQLAAAGLVTLYLSDNVGVAGNPTPAGMLADGVGFLGASTAAPDSYITSMVAAGLDVVVWTVSNRATVEHYLSIGARSVFTDDPWRVSDYVPFTFRERFEDLSVPPHGIANSTSTLASGERVGLDAAAGGLTFTHYSVDGATARYALGRLGLGSNAFKLRFKTELGTSAASTAAVNDNGWAWALYIGENTAGGPHVENTANERFWLAIRRRSGTLDLYYKGFGGAAANVGTWPNAAAAVTRTGTQPEHEVSVEITSGQQVTIRDLTMQAAGTDVPVVWTPPDASQGLGWVSTSSYLTLAARSSTTTIKDVRITR